MIKQISKDEIDSSSVELTLANRPSNASRYGVGNMSPSEVKAAFDRLPRLIAGYYNELVRVIEENKFADEIYTGIREGHRLSDIFADILSGALATYLCVGGEDTLDEFYAYTKNFIRSGEEVPDGNEKALVGGIYIACLERPRCYICVGEKDGKSIWRMIESPVAAEIDPVPANGSENPVSSGGVYLALEEKTPTYRTVAGIPLNENITAAMLSNALALALSSADGLGVTDSLVLVDGENIAKKLSLDALVASLAGTDEKSLAMGSHRHDDYYAEKEHTHTEYKNASGSITLLPSEFSSEGILTVSLTEMNESDSIFLYPHSRGDEELASEAGLFISSSGNTLTVEAESLPSENITLDYTIVRV